jgi:hypothetical protein
VSAREKDAIIVAVEVAVEVLTVVLIILPFFVGGEKNTTKKKGK